jgi:hypothetical protein
MHQRLTSTDVSLEELLSGRYAFTIPEYQRDYSWTREEANQLIDDIAAVTIDPDRADGDTPYFLGSLLLVPTATDAADADAQFRMEVVDGQQRLVTLTILFAVLRDILVETGHAETRRPETASASATTAEHNLLASEHRALAKMVASPAASIDRFHLMLRGADAVYFRDAVQAPGGSCRTHPAATGAVSQTKRNIDEVRRTIRTRFRKEYTLDELLAFSSFARRHVRVLTVVADDFDYAYQIFLTINDRGKRLSVEDIFRGEILGPLDREQRERFDTVIDEMEKYREAGEGTRTKGKTFFTHLATIEGWASRGIIKSLKQAVQRHGGPRRFVADVFTPMAAAYLEVKGTQAARLVAGAAGDWLTALRWLERHGDDDWVPIAMLGLKRHASDPDALAAFLRALDRYAHGLMALGCGRDARRRKYAPILSEIKASPRMPDPGRLFAFTAQTEKAIVRNMATRLHMIDPPTARLMLVRADQAVSGRPFAFYEPYLGHDRTDPRRFTVEHVCPKGDVKDSQWLEHFPRQLARSRAAQCIGNLILVPEEQNRRVSQHAFAAKKRVFFAEGQSSPFVLTEMLRDEDSWDGAAIERRYRVIMEALRELWHLQGAIPRCPALGPAQ